MRKKRKGRRLTQLPPLKCDSGGRRVAGAVRASGPPEHHRSKRRRRGPAINLAGVSAS
jgi:hypothetical protein